MTDEPEPEHDTVTRGGYVLPPPPHSGDHVGPVDDPDRYELLGAGTTGGEGTTWRARYHGRLQRPLPLAVKQLRPPPGARPDWPGDEERRRWQDQATLLRHVRPGHVVHLYEVFAGPPPHQAGKGRSDETRAAYLVMEWVEGPTLGALCRGRPATAETIKDRLGYVEQAAAALSDLSSATRSAGNPSLHRDVKPGNCIVNDSRGLVLIDISTLRLVDDGFDPVGLHTPQYTAPEVRAGPHLPRTPATEAYALGALAAFCLTGRDPAPGADLRAELTEAARHAGIADAPALAAHLLAALDADPEGRPTDLTAWSRRLTALGRVRRWRRPLAAGVVTAAVAAMTAGVVLWGPSRGGEPTAGRTSAASVATGSITSPVEGAAVKQCAYFTGTATVPAGMTLILAMRNLANGDPTRYVQDVFGWDKPDRLSRWQGAQYFGDGDDSVGQKYRVQLIAVRVDDVRAWNNGPDDPGSDLAAGGTVLDQVDVRRVAGSVANRCVGP